MTALLPVLAGEDRQLSKYPRAGSGADPTTPQPDLPYGSAGRHQDHAGDQQPEDDHPDDDPSGDQVALVARTRATTAEIGAANPETVGTRDGRHQDLLVVLIERDRGRRRAGQRSCGLVSP
jgi:hypothetical protein